VILVKKEQSGHTQQVEKMSPFIIACLMFWYSHTTHFRPQLQSVPKGFHFMFDSWVFWLFNFFSCQINCNINKPYYNFILILPMTVRSPTGNYMLFHLMIALYIHFKTHTYIYMLFFHYFIFHLSSLLPLSRPFSQVVTI
jgi:hypothetical protein